MARRILVLDTPGGDLATLSETFRTAAGEGCEVQRTSTAREFEEKIRSGLPYDLVVTRLHGVLPSCGGVRGL